MDLRYEFVEHASKYDSDVWLEKDGQRVNAKSILGLLMLAAERDCPVKIIVDGLDEGSAMDALASLLQQGDVG